MKGRFNVVSMLARRFLKSKHSDGFLSFISWVSIVGVSLGVLALVVVTSVIGGFEDELIRVISGTNGDLVLFSRGSPIHNVADVENKVRRLVPELRGLSASFMAELMVAGPAGVAGAILEGIDLETIDQTADLPNKIVRGRMPRGPGEVAVAYAVADRVGVDLGDKLRLIAPFSGEEFTEKSENLAPKAFDAEVVGILKLGFYQYDSKFVIGTLGYVQNSLGLKDQVTTFRLKITDPYAAQAIADRLSDQFGYPYRAKDWSQFNKNLFYAIKLEKAVIVVLLGAIVLVAAFNVVSTLMMMIHDKSKVMAILKAMGLRKRDAFRLFVWIGMSIGLTGTIIGVAIGLGLNEILKKTEFIRLPADVYHLAFLPVRVEWLEIVSIAAGALMVCFVATLYPAWQIARKAPLEGIRYD